MKLSFLKVMLAYATLTLPSIANAGVIIDVFSSSKITMTASDNALSTVKGKFSFEWEIVGQPPSTGNGVWDIENSTPDNSDFQVGDYFGVDLGVNGVSNGSVLSASAFSVYNFRIQNDSSVASTHSFTIDYSSLGIASADNPLLDVATVKAFAGLWIGGIDNSFSVVYDNLGEVDYTINPNYLFDSIANETDENSVDINSNKFLILMLLLKQIALWNSAS